MNSAGLIAEACCTLWITCTAFIAQLSGYLLVSFQESFVKTMKNKSGFISLIYARKFEVIGAITGSRNYRHQGAKGAIEGLEARK